MGWSVSRKPNKIQLTLNHLISMKVPGPFGIFAKLKLGWQLFADFNLSQKVHSPRTHPEYVRIYYIVYVWGIYIVSSSVSRGEQQKLAVTLVRRADSCWTLARSRESGTWIGIGLGLEIGIGMFGVQMLSSSWRFSLSFSGSAAAENLDHRTMRDDDKFFLPAQRLWQTP